MHILPFIHYGIEGTIHVPILTQGWQFGSPLCWGHVLKKISLPSGVWLHGYGRRKHPHLCRRRRRVHSEVGSEPREGRPQPGSQTSRLLPFFCAFVLQDAPDKSAEWEGEIKHISKTFQCFTNLVC